MYNAFCAWWGQWGSVEVKGSVELHFWREFWVDARRSLQVEYQVILWHKEVPDMEKKFWVLAVEDYNEMILEGPNLPLCIISVMDIGGYELEFNIIKSNTVLDHLQELIVQNL